MEDKVIFSLLKWSDLYDILNFIVYKQQKIMIEQFSCILDGIKSLLLKILMVTSTILFAVFFNHNVENVNILSYTSDMKALPC